MLTLDRFKNVDDGFRIVSTRDHSLSIATISSLENISDKGVVFIKNEKYFKKFQEKIGHVSNGKNVGAIFENSFYKKMDVAKESEFLDRFSFLATVESVDLALSRFSKLFYDEFNKNSNDFVDGRKTGTADVDPSSTIADGVFLGKNVRIAARVQIHAGCVILSHSVIGENTVIYPNVTIYRHVKIGRDCRVHANTAIGSDGYGYNYFKGEHLKVWHFGGVEIGDTVEIGSGTSIDQGTFSPTVIGPGTKIDNQVHLAHNCKIGKGVLITGQAGFAGSVTLGDYVAMGGCANFAPGVTVGQGAQIGGMAGVTSDVPAGAVYGGHPARPLTEWLRSVAALRKISSRQKDKSRDST